MASASELDDRFREVWRQEILNQAWESLQNSNDSSDHVYLTVLQLKAENPQSTAAELASKIEVKLERKDLTEDWVRQNLRRARKKFGKSLRYEVSQTLGQRQNEDVDEELAELELLKYCD